MIESVCNGLQLVSAGLCAAGAAWYAIVGRQRTWLLFGIFSAAYFLGDLYWELWLVFYGETPPFSYIPDLSWYTSYLFLFLLLLRFRDDAPRGAQARVLWPIPLFTFGMAAFYLQWGRLISNLLCAALMSLLLWQAIGGLLALRAKGPQAAPERRLYAAALLFYLAEYGLWTSSCFWDGDTMRNPYFWFELLLTLCFPLFFAALRRAVDA